MPEEVIGEIPIITIPFRARSAPESVRVAGLRMDTSVRKIRNAKAFRRYSVYESLPMWVRSKKCEGT